MTERVCTSCYYVGEPTTQGIGSFLMDVFVWMMFISLSMLSSLFLLLIVPLAWTLYHLAVYRTTTCPQCGRLDMVSKTSRKGHQALKGPKWAVTYKAPEEMDDIKAHPVSVGQVTAPEQALGADNGQRVGERRKAVGC